LWSDAAWLNCLRRQSRNPNAEIRRKSETRNPKRRIIAKTFRLSVFGFPLDFGIRTSDFVLMWPVLAIVAVAVVAVLALHFSWQRRFATGQQRLRVEHETVQQRQQAAAEQSRAEQEALFDSMAEGVLLLDETGRIRLANRAFATLFNVTGDVRGKTLMEALRRHEVTELVDRLGAEGRVLGYEMKLPGLDERWLQVNAAAISAREEFPNSGSEGRRLGTILVFHDLTRLKRLERTREEFVANVSHELRTPLSLIKGYVETLLDGARNNPEVAERFLRIIERNAHRLDLLIQDLLTISALESGRVTLNLQPVALRGLAGKVLADLKTQAEARGIKLVNELPELSATADGDRLEQVLANLVDNAIKYGRAEGAVTVGGRVAEDCKVEVFVQDDGPGIPPDSLERVFERFYRIDKARSREQGGTGLGLSIVKHIVQSHGGAVWARSELGQGTTFFFTLPQGQGGSQPELIRTTGL
jgi:two-component system phosphate regulon sensor histidine kinase PhoR